MAVVAAVWLAAAACERRAPFVLEAGSSGEDDLPAEAMRVDALAKACDGDLATRWSTEAPMKPWYYLSIRFPKPRRVAAIILDTRPSPDDWPRAFVVEASRGGGPLRVVFRGGPEATRKGVTTIKFPSPVTADLFVITLRKGNDFYYWSVHELTVQYAE